MKKFKENLRARLEAVPHHRYTSNFLNALPYWVGAILTGITAVGYAKLFHLAEEGTKGLLESESFSNYWFFALTPFCFLLAWFLVVRFAPYSRGSGIPQVSAAVELSNPIDAPKVDKLLSIRVMFIKIISSIVLVFGGGVIGREGPTIQIAGAIFKKLHDWLPSWFPKVSKRNMLVTGAAAGLAAAFNTPLGGIVFAIEELTKTHFNYFKSALLTGVIIAGLTALHFSGSYLYLGFPRMSGLSGWIILPVLIVGLVAGFGGAFMGKVLLQVMNWKKRFKKPSQQAMYVAACGLIIAALAIFVDFHAMGSGKEIMEETLFTDAKYVHWYQPLLSFFGTIISFSVGAAGGIFAPSLSAGASIGSVLSGILHLSFSDSNLIIICGMAAFLAGITRSPFTAAILVLEMTETNDIIFYLMLAGLIGNLIASTVDKHSFYDNLKDQYLDDLKTGDEPENPAEPV